MKGHSDLIERGWFLGRYSATPKGVGEASFDTEVGPGESCLTEDQLQTDVDTLKNSARTIATWVDEHVAHATASPKGPAVTFGELERALDKVARLFRRYHLLVAQRDGD